MSAVSIRLDGIEKRFGATRAVDGISLEVPAGGRLVLLGPSGCGKTTLLRAIAGLERIDRGTIELGGRIVTGEGTQVPPERRGVGVVFQDHALFPHLSVEANVAYGARDPRRVRELLALVGLEGLGDRMPGALSGGQQQRVALARALAPEPGVIVLDEPFSNLDADLREQVRDEVRAILDAAGMTAIFVTHDQLEAFELANEIAVMRDGRIEQIGTPEAVYHTPRTRFVADSVGQAAFVPALIESGQLICELGTFPFATPVADGVAELLVRPEDIVLVASGDADILERRFHGPLNRYRVRLPGGAEVLSVGSSQTLHPVGSKVGVRFEPDHLVVFRGDARVDWVPTREHTGTDVDPEPTS